MRWNCHGQSGGFFSSPTLPLLSIPPQCIPPTPPLPSPLGYSVPTSCEEADFSAPGVFSLGEAAHFGEKLPSVRTEGRPRSALENIRVTYIEDTVLSVTRAGQEAHPTT